MTQLPLKNVIKIYENQKNFLTQTYDLFHKEMIDLINMIYFTLNLFPENTCNNILLIFHVKDLVRFFVL